MNAVKNYDTVGQGKIRIQTESPYEKLDSNTELWLNHLKRMWTLLRKCDATTQVLYDFFSKSKNPYKSALQIMITSGDFYSGKLNSLAYYIMETFSKWLRLKKPTFVHFISEDLKLDAFNLVIKQKNYALFSLVINLYKMVEHKEIFLDSIRYLIATNRYKEACQCADLLKLHSYFKIEDFLVPLVFQDKYVIVEQFLRSSEKHQIELVKFLDDLLGQKSIQQASESIIRNLNINNAKPIYYYKPLNKLIAKIVRTFNLPSSVCPNVNLKKRKGAVQFLLHNRYIKGTIGGEGWAEMALEAVGDDANLQLELVEGVALNGDLKEALAWADRFRVPEKTWPYRLREFSGKLKNQKNEFNWEANWDEEPQSSATLKIHHLPIPESQIIVVDTAFGFFNFLTGMSFDVSVVGFDAEWKPTFGIKKCDIALIQVATLDHVYILDMIALSSVAPQSLWEKFAIVFFGNSGILKLGYGTNQDVVLIKDTLRKLHGLRISESGFLDMATLWKTLVCEHDFSFPFALTSNSQTSGSLSELIELCFGEKLDKSDRFSNWENRPLRKTQIQYAALDAYCLLEAYNVIEKECESQGILLSEVVNGVLNGVFPKAGDKKKRKPRQLTDGNKSLNQGSETKIGSDGLPLLPQDFK